MSLVKGNIEELTLKNKYYRKVIDTNECNQIVLMHLNAGEEIGAEIHPNAAQFVRVEAGRGVAYLDGYKYLLKDGDFLNIAPGVLHNIKATSEDLKIYVIYSPPQHQPGEMERYKPISDEHNHES